MEKHYIRSEDLIQDSFRLAWQVYEDGIALIIYWSMERWSSDRNRGAKFFSVLGVPSDHIAIDFAL